MISSIPTKKQSIDEIVASIPNKEQSVQQMVDSIPPKSMTRGLFGTSIGQNSPVVANMRTLADMSRSGLRQLGDITFGRQPQKREPSLVDPRTRAIEAPLDVFRPENLRRGYD